MANLSLSSAKKRNKNTSKTKSGSNVWFTVAVAAAVLAAIGIFVVLSQVTATTTYYVLNQDVDARSQITPDMLSPVTVSTGGQPRNALDISAFSTGEPVFAKYALPAGEVVTPALVGLRSPIQEGIPDDYVVASFSAPAETSAAGKAARGDYIDIIAVSESPDGAGSAAQYVLRHVLVLDTAADLAAEQTSGDEVYASEDAGIRSGIPTIYTVALPQEDAAKLALVQSLPLTVVLSPVAYESDGVPTDPGFVSPVDVFGPDARVSDSGAGTDPSFGANNAKSEEGAKGSTSEPTQAPETEAPTSSEEEATGEAEETEEGSEE